MDMLDVNDSTSEAKLIAPAGIEVKRVFNLDAASPNFLPTIFSIVSGTVATVAYLAPMLS
jgi:hypothetical protein